MAVYIFDVIQTLPARCYPKINYLQCKMSFLFVFVMMIVLLIGYSATHYGVSFSISLSPLEMMFFSSLLAVNLNDHRGQNCCRPVG